MRPWLQRARMLLLALAGGLGLLGCASLLHAPGPEAGLGVEIRPAAPPEYDVLVAQQHLSEGRIPEAIAAYQRAVAKDDGSAYLHELLADALARSNRLDEALTHARRAYEIDPDDVSTRHLLAQLDRLNGDLASAESVLVDASGAPRDPDDALLLYQIFLEDDRPSAALEVAQWMVAQNPDDLRAHIAVATAYQKLGRSDDAEKALRAALAADPDNLRIYTALARLRRERGDHAGEIEIYREILARRPDNHAALLALAEAQMAEDDLEGAIVTYKEIEQRFPDDPRATVRLGFLLYEAGHFDEAATHFEKVLSENPSEYEIAFFLGIAQRRLGHDDQARAAFSSIPASHKYYAEARTQLAVIDERRGEYKSAIAELQRALAIEESRELELYSATLRSKAGDFDGAVAYLKALLAKEPDNDELLYNLGVVYGESGHTDEAIAYMQRALAINPDNASALNYIGYSWADSGVHLDEAEKMIVRAIELRPDDGYIVDSLGWVYYMRARPLIEAGEQEKAHQLLDRALAELERADELTGGDPVISEHMGDAYLLLNDRRRALDKFEEAQNLGPRADEQPHLHEKLENLRRELE